MIRMNLACRCVRTLSKVFKLNQTCFKAYHVMLIYSKPENQTPDESVEVSNVTEAEESQTMSKVMLITFFDMSFYHKTRWPISQSTGRPCGVYFVQGARRDESCVRRNRACFIMTSHLLTTPWASSSCWPRGILQGQSPYSHDLVSHKIFFSSSIKSIIKGDQLWRSSRRP